MAERPHSTLVSLISVLAIMYSSYNRSWSRLSLSPEGSLSRALPPAVARSSLVI